MDESVWEARIGKPIDLGAHQGPRVRTTEPELTKAECVVGLECRIRVNRTWHTGKIVQVHSTDGGLCLYRFQSPNLYVLVTREEIKRMENHEQL